MFKKRKDVSVCASVCLCLSGSLSVCLCVCLLTDGVASLDGVGGVVQRGEAGVGPATLELDEQGLLGRAGEVASPLEGAVRAAHTLLFLGWGWDDTHTHITRTHTHQSCAGIIR